MTIPATMSAIGSGTDSRLMSGCATMRSSMARMMAPNAISTTPNRYQIRIGVAITATTISVRLKKSE